MANLRGSATDRLLAIRETLLLATVSCQDHGQLLNSVLAVIETIDKQVKPKTNKDVEPDDYADLPHGHQYRP